MQLTWYSLCPGTQQTFALIPVQFSDQSVISKIMQFLQTAFFVYRFKVLSTHFYRLGTKKFARCCHRVAPRACENYSGRNYFGKEEIMPRYFNQWPEQYHKADVNSTLHQLRKLTRNRMVLSIPIATIRTAFGMTAWAKGLSRTIFLAPVRPTCSISLTPFCNLFSFLHFEL